MVEFFPGGPLGLGASLLPPSSQIWKNEKNKEMKNSKKNQKPIQKKTDNIKITKNENVNNEK